MSCTRNNGDNNRMNWGCGSCSTCAARSRCIGYQNGFRAGLEEGRSTGFHSGFNAGFQAGFEAGRNSENNCNNNCTNHCSTVLDNGCGRITNC